jgi:hypothetical protein
MKINKMKFIFWLMLFTGTVYVSCRKTDSRVPAETKENIENQFFNSRSTANPVVKAVMDFMKRKNESSPFVEKTVQQIGYPYWDKAIIVSLPGVSGRGAADSTSVIYIPFVRDSQNYVNASLAIRTTPSDTVIRYVSDWQYSQLPNNINSLIDSAEKHALFFMVMDNFVFGRRDFVITDTMLFKTSTYRAASVHIEVNTGTSGRNDVMSSPAPIVCVNAAMNLTQCTTCPGNVSVTQCWSEYYGVGTPDAVPAGGGGGSGGGWAPGGGTSPPPAEPIDTLLKKHSELANRHRDSIAVLCESDHTERAFTAVLFNGVLDTLSFRKGNAGEVKPNYYIWGGRILKGVWHYHPDYEDGTPGSWPSGGDVAQLYDKDQGFVSIIDTKVGRYALVLEDKSKLNTWKAQSGNGPVPIVARLINLVNSDSRAWSTGAIYVQMTKEKLLQVLGSSSNCGIGLYEATSINGTTFVKVN